MCAKTSLVADFGHVVMLGKCLNAEVKPAGQAFKWDDLNSWRGFSTLSIPTTLWLTDFLFFFSFGISRCWKLSRNLATSLSLLKLLQGQIAAPTMLGRRVKCIEKDMHLLSSLSVWASISTLYNAAIYWQQSSLRILLKLFVEEWQSCFECHCWRWGSGSRW